MVISQFELSFCNFWRRADNGGLPLENHPWYFLIIDWDNSKVISNRSGISSTVVTVILKV